MARSRSRRRRVREADRPGASLDVDLSEAALDRYIVSRRGLDCDLCGQPFSKRGGPHEAGEDGKLCTPCFELPEPPC
jgi:hypothetical protein